MRRLRWRLQICGTVDPLLLVVFACRIHWFASLFFFSSCSLCFLNHGSGPAAKNSFFFRVSFFLAADRRAHCQRAEKIIFCSEKLFSAQTRTSLRVAMSASMAHPGLCPATAFSACFRIFL